MEHFSIIRALSRAAMPAGSPAVRKQIERLRDALKEDGEAKQASALSAILSNADKTKEMAPSRIERSRARFSGEELSRNAKPPVDRETAAPLAELIFPSDPTAPIFDETMTAAISSIIDEWSDVDSLLEVGIEPARTCLIYGEPGTGKTRLALWMASQLQLPVVLVRLDGLVSSFLGTTARNIGNLFSFANKHRCLLLLDEFDAIAKVRDDPQEVGEIKRVVNALLQNLDGRKDVGLTVGITNHPDLLDPAVWRRFEIQLEIPRPDFAMREQIAQLFMSPLAPPESHLRMIAWFTEGATGAEIETLVRTYKKASVRDSENKELIDTLRRFATLNAARIQRERRALIFGDTGSLFRAMKDDPDLSLPVSEIAQLAGRDRSTVSRQISRTTNSESSGDADG